MKQTFIDRLINYFNPESGLRRLKSRKQAEVISSVVRKYEGAGHSRRTENWTTSNTDANTEVRTSIAKLRSRSRDLVRNNAWAERAVSVLENNVIGRGIVTQFFSGNTRIESQINQLWKEWTDSFACDWSDQMTWPMMQRMIVRTIAESGESLCRLHFMDSRSKAQVPLKLELLEPDFIATDNYTTTAKSNNTIIDGIELNSNGRKVAYYLYKAHPGSTDLYSLMKGGATETFRLDGKYLLQAYKINRPGQLRGVPIFAPVIIPMRELDEYMDAQIVKQKVSACFSAFILDPNGSNDLTQNEIEIAENLEPGAMPILGPGQDVKTATPPPVDGFGDFVATNLRSIACGLGLSYEALTGDLSQVNFSSARMGWLEMSRNIDMWRNQVMIPMILDPVVNAFLQAISLKGVKVPTDLNWYHTAPRREMIDPTREVPALIDGIRGGLYTLNDVIKQFGQDPETHLMDIQKMNAQLDEKEIVLDSDPRKVAQNGQRSQTQNVTP